MIASLGLHRGLLFQRGPLKARVNFWSLVALQNIASSYQNFNHITVPASRSWFTTGRSNGSNTSKARIEHAQSGSNRTITPRNDGRMRLSNFWAPTGQIAEPGNQSGHEHTADLLVRAGYVRPTHAGIFQFLPLGYRVQAKIEKLLDKHMTQIGASKMSLSTFSSEALWEKSGRLKGDTSELFKLEDRRGSKFLLSPTHEEEITTLVADSVASYRELPLRLYQVTRKYRDERRARAGLLRTREFLMKDLYTFDMTEEEALSTYRTVCDAYSALFRDLKIPYHVANADSGSIGGDVNHEYHIVSDMGEDSLAVCSGCGFTANFEVLDTPEALTHCPKCNSQDNLSTKKAIELAHAFFLGTKYSEPLEATFDAENGHRQHMQMGCYGVGISRMVAGIADILRDSKGLNWPGQIAPFESVVIPSKELDASAATIYDYLAAPDADGDFADVILDDRDKPLVWKLKDADLIGYPVLVVLGRAWQNSGHVELQCRRLGISETLPAERVRTRVLELLAKL